MTVEEVAPHLAALESFVKGKSTSGDFETSLQCIFENEHAVSTHKRCLTVVLGLLGTHIDHALMVYILEHLPVFTAMLSKYPLLQKEYVRALVTLTFSSTAPGIRLKASVALVNFSKKFTKQTPDILKQAYQAFSKTCHSVTAHTLPMLSLSTSSLVELFAVNPKVSHAYTLKLLRVLGTQVKDALKHPNTSTIQALQSWKWVAPVRFFARHLVTSNDSMQVPFIQMVCAALSVKVSMNTLPFHFHMLACISDVPFLVPNALGALLQVESILSRANSRQESGKPRAYHFPALLTMSDSEIGTRSYHDTAADEAFYLILKYLAGLSVEASFPEVSDNVIGFLKSMHTKNPRIKQHVSLLSEKCELVSAAVKDARLDYAPLTCDGLSIKKENELTVLLREIEKKRMMKAKMASAGVVDRDGKGGKEGSGKRQKTDKTAARKKKQPKTASSADEAQEEEDDVLEDFELSSEFE